MKKKEALQVLKNRIKTDGVIKYSYIKKDDEGKACYCAVGHLMDICGVDMEIFQDDAELNGESIERAYRQDDIFQPVKELGFTIDELHIMQSYNDGQDVDRLTQYIEALMLEA